MVGSADNVLKRVVSLILYREVILYSLHNIFNYSYSTVCVAMVTTSLPIYIYLYAQDLALDWQPLQEPSSGHLGQGHTRSTGLSQRQDTSVMTPTNFGHARCAHPFSHLVML